MKLLIIAALLLFTGTTQAQTYKCISPAGKVEYRGSACEDQRQERRMAGGTVSGIDAMPQEEMQRLNLPTPEPRGPQVYVIQGYNPLEKQIKNLETSASSVTIGSKEKKFLQQEVARLKAAGEGSYTADDLKRLKDAQDDQHRIDPNDRARARAAGEAIHLKNGSEAIQQGIVADREAEQARTASRRAAAARQGARAAAQAATAAQPSYDRLRECVGTYCTGQSGERYQAVPGVPDRFNREDGKHCSNGPSGLTCW